MEHDLKWIDEHGDLSLIHDDIVTIAAITRFEDTEDDDLALWVADTFYGGYVAEEFYDFYHGDKDKSLDAAKNWLFGVVKERLDGEERCNETD